MKIGISASNLIIVLFLQNLSSYHFEPKPNHLARKNLFFPPEASLLARAGAGLGDCKGGEISLPADKEESCHHQLYLSYEANKTRSNLYQSYSFIMTLGLTNY